MSRWNFLLVAALTAANHCVNAFYMPGVRPMEYKVGQQVDLKVNSITSTRTQIPRPYYRFPFCRPTGGPKMASENLGEFLTGNKIQSSPYRIHMLKEEHCAKVCQMNIDDKDAKLFQRIIKSQYHNNWIIDNLPSALIMKERRRYAGGFPIGFAVLDSGNVYVYNHVNIHIDYHQYDPAIETYRVVGFAVDPVSRMHEFNNGYKWDGKEAKGWSEELITCNGETQQYQIVSPGENIIYTYDVIWTKSDIAWTSRWDIYLNEDHMVPTSIHWYSIANSFLVVVALSIFVVSVLSRNLKRDFAAYNALSVLDDDEDEEEDESGWKLVHADVFRPPDNYPMLFCVCCGVGSQLALTILITICLSAIGFLNPARRGSLMNGILSFFVLTGIVAGYVSSRLYKSFKGRLWQLCTIVTALLFPGIAFGIFVFFNIILSFMNSSASAPFLDILIVAAMWCCVSVPLVFVGAYFGYKQEPIGFPTVTSTIARAIPPPTLVSHPLFCTLIAGVVPFSAAYVELFFIMTSLWMDQYYYVFGFTLIVYIILIVTCVEVTLLLVYHQLCNENHRWWWFSFVAPGSTALYTFIYSIYWFGTLHASRKIMTYFLYFGYMGLISSAMLLVTGTVGALASLWFIKMMFGNIKVD